jgi:hypothetical protein
MTVAAGRKSTGAVALEADQEALNPLAALLFDGPAALRAEAKEPVEIGRFGFSGWEVRTRELSIPGTNARVITQLSAFAKRPWKEVATASLKIFGPKNPIRLFSFFIVESRLFDWFILLLITINSYLLAVLDYRDPGAMMNKLNAMAESPLLAVFIVECLLKIIAYGVIMGEHAYLADGWNWLDFIVVVTGVIAWMMKDSDVDLTFLRACRVMRPLRSLTVVTEMKVVVNTLLRSIPQLGNVALLGIFLGLLFGILGINLFGGVMYRTCRAVDNPILTSLDGQQCWSYPMDLSSDSRLCGRMYACAPTAFCRSTYIEDIAAYRPSFFDGIAEVAHLAPTVLNDWGRTGGLPWCYDVAVPDNPFADEQPLISDGYNFGLTTFDDLPQAFRVLFQCITMEGWVDVII